MDQVSSSLKSVEITHNQLRANKAQSRKNLLTGNHTIISQKSAGSDDSGNKAHDWQATSPDQSKQPTNAIG